MADTYQQNRDTRRAAIIAKLGLPNDGTAWSYEQRTAYLKASAAYTLAAPAQFTADDLAIARRVLGATFEPLETYTVTDAAKDFGEEFARQAVSINDAVNPLAEANRAGFASTLKWTLVAGVLIYVAIKAGALDALMGRKGPAA